MQNKFKSVSIANNMRASQGLASQSVSTPAPNQQIPGWDWKNQLWREPGYIAPSLSAFTDSDNYFTKMEPHQLVKNSVFNQPTGQEPIYGQINFQLNPLDNGKTNSVPFTFQQATRVTDSKNPFKFIIGTTDHYPVSRGVPNYRKFEGASPQSLRYR